MSKKPRVTLHALASAFREVTGHNPTAAEIAAALAAAKAEERAARKAKPRRTITPPKQDSQPSTERQLIVTHYTPGRVF